MIDRATGVLTTWPGVPADAVTRLYRDHQPDGRRPAAGPSIPRSSCGATCPAPGPTDGAAHLTVDGRLFIGPRRQG